MGHDLAAAMYAAEHEEDPDERDILKYPMNKFGAEHVTYRQLRWYLEGVQEVWEKVKDAI